MTPPPQYVRVQPGDRLGHLTVLSWNESRHRWLCRCDCGRECLRVPRKLVGIKNPMCAMCYIAGGAGEWGRR